MLYHADAFRRVTGGQVLIHLRLTCCSQVQREGEQHRCVPRGQKVLDIFSFPFPSNRPERKSLPLCHRHWKLHGGLW